MVMNIHSGYVSVESDLKVGRRNNGPRPPR